MGIVGSFGEAYWCYAQLDRTMGTMVPEIAFVQRVLAQGVPVLVGSAYEHQPESDSP